ncbi:MAG: hypothetical protein HFJ08_12525 [Lachnospiraceae bacterium]|nr:hypothetical protein [Lachnospiraceae bacterium]
MPEVVFWNGNAANATFHVTRNDNSVSLVSGCSTNIFRDVMENIGATLYDESGKQRTVSGNISISSLWRHSCLISVSSLWMAV